MSLRVMPADTGAEEQSGRFGTHAWRLSSRGMMDTVQVTIIEASPKTLGTRLLALWRYRAFYPLLFRELCMKKFRGTLLGFWWLVIRPLVPSAFAIAVFTFVVPIESPGLPYAVFYFSGFITWNLFQSTVIFMPRTLLWMQGMMRRTYFPKLLVPAASLGPPLIELLVIVVLFAATLGYFFAATGAVPLRLGPETLWVLPCLFMALLFGISIGMAASVIALFFRDIVFSVSYFAQLMMFLTPVIYPVSFVPEDYRWIVYVFNPAAKLVEVSRWALTGVGDFDPFFLALSFGTITLLFVGSITFFLRAEAYLADAL
jgi:lipopolysaccharide transport system permease protein